MWNKFKIFLKKYWGYIISFFAGVFTFACIDTKRDRATDKHLRKLAEQLEQYKLLLAEAERHSGELAEELMFARQYSDESANDIAILEKCADEIGKLSNGSTEKTERIAELNKDINNKLSDLGTNISALGEFIRKNKEND